MARKRGTEQPAATMTLPDEPPVVVVERQATHREDPFLGFSEAAVILGVTRQTVYNWVVIKRILKAIWRGPRMVVRRSEIDRFLSQGKC